jgi:hypothetical protein
MIFPSITFSPENALLLLFPLASLFLALTENIGFYFSVEILSFETSKSGF